LGDFGLAKKNMSNRSKFNSKAGTEIYMSPDVLNENYTYNSDIW